MSRATSEGQRACVGGDACPEHCKVERRLKLSDLEKDKY